MSAVRYELACFPEDFDPSEQLDTEAQEWVREQLRAGNEWAWCRVEVRAVVELDGQTFMGVDHLGSCTYESESAFKEDGYYADMKREALADLVRFLQHEQTRGKVATLVLRAFRKASES